MATTTIKKGQPGSRSWFRDSFVLHKLHSLTGVLPIGLFMIFHLVANSYSLRGETEFNTTVKAIGYLPFVKLVEVGAIFVPLLFHSIYGFLITAEMRSNLGVYQYGRNWLYWLQRVSGIIAFVYLVIHVGSTTGLRFRYEATGGHEAGFQAISYAAMAYRFANLGYLLLYVVGITSAAFHLANGLFNFGIRWGITVGDTAQKISARLWAGLGVALTVLGVWTAVNFHNVSKNFPTAQGERINLAEEYRSLDDLVKDHTRRAASRPVTQPGAAPTSPEGNVAPLQ
jgi:succinate dehydrogenase / fumarate reductase cytochrome b subunit